MKFLEDIMDPDATGLDTRGNDIMDMVSNWGTRFICGVKTPQQCCSKMSEEQIIEESIQCLYSKHVSPVHLLNYALMNKTNSLKSEKRPISYDDETHAYAVKVTRAHFLLARHADHDEGVARLSSAMEYYNNAKPLISQNSLSQMEKLLVPEKLSS